MSVKALTTVIKTAAKGKGWESALVPEQSRSTKSTLAAVIKQPLMPIFGLLQRFWNCRKTCFFPFSTSFCSILLHFLPFFPLHPHFFRLLWNFGFNVVFLAIQRHFFYQKVVNLHTYVLLVVIKSYKILFLRQ